MRTLDERRLLAVASLQDGVVSRSQALSYLTPAMIRHRVGTRRWQALHRGVYLTASDATTDSQRRWAAVLAAGPDACLGGVSALQLHGLQRIRATAVDVLVPEPTRLSPKRGVRLHRTRQPPLADEVQCFRPPATLPARSIVDAVQWARSDDEARLIVAASFQQKLGRLGDIEAVCAAMPNVVRRQLLLHTATDCAGGSHSLAELDFVALCRRAGLPTPTRQLAFRDQLGRRRYLDAVFDEWMVAVEVDGGQHTEVEQAWDDALRQNALGLAGYVVLRYPSFVVRTRPAEVAADIRAALTRAGWRPAAER